MKNKTLNIKDQDIKQMIDVMSQYWNIVNKIKKDATIIQIYYLIMRERFIDEYINLYKYFIVPKEYPDTVYAMQFEGYCCTTTLLRIGYNYNNNNCTHCHLNTEDNYNHFFNTCPKLYNLQTFYCTLLARMGINIEQHSFYKIEIREDIKSYIRNSFKAVYFKVVNTYKHPKQRSDRWYLLSLLFKNITETINYLKYYFKHKSKDDKRFHYSKKLDKMIIILRKTKAENINYWKNINKNRQ